MTMLATTTTVLSGLNILVNFQYHNKGPGMALEFLKNHPPANRPADLPEFFWTELASLGTEIPTAPQKSGPAASSLVAAATATATTAEETTGTTTAAKATAVPTSSASSVQDEAEGTGGPRLKRRRKD